MADPLFGIVKEDGRTRFDIESSVFADVIRKFPKATPMEAQLLLRDAYDQSYGIFDHTRQRFNEKSVTDPSKRRPLSSVAVHTPEDIGGASKFKDIARLFARLRIAERFHISILEYLDLPREYAAMLIAEAESLMSAAESEQDRAKRQLEQSLQQGRS